MCTVTAVQDGIFGCLYAPVSSAFWFCRVVFLTFVRRKIFKCKMMIFSVDIGVGFIASFVHVVVGGIEYFSCSRNKINQFRTGMIKLLSVSPA